MVMVVEAGRWMLFGAGGSMFSGDGSNYGVMAYEEHGGGLFV